jgi:drug/metabolite transporter (DMT)-like permease
MPSSYVGELAAVGTAILWTFSALAWTSAGRQIGAISVCFIRLVIACLILAAYRQAVHGQALPLDAAPRTWLPLILSGFMGFFVADVFLFKAFLLIGPRLSLLIMSLSPPMTVVISQVLLGEFLDARQWLAMGVTLAGIAWVVLEQPEREPHPHQRWAMWWGCLLATVGALGQAVGAVLARDAMREPISGTLANCDAVTGTFIRILGGLAGYLLLITLLGRWPPTVAAAGHRRAMLIVIFGTLVGPVFGVILYMLALSHCQAGVVSTILATTPVLILPFSILLYREEVSLRAVAGAIVSVVGVAMLMLMSRPSP